MSRRPLLAIFVGGKSRRMGTPKGLLRLEPNGATIIDALVHEGSGAGLDAVLVGDAEPYEGVAPGVPRIADEPPGAGPLGGLRAAIVEAASRGHHAVVAVACDMPLVSRQVLSQVADATERSEAAVVAPRRAATAPWEPMLAGYVVRRLAPVLDEALAQGVRSFQSLFARLDVASLPLTSAIETALTDWDTPDDVPT
jgi:molybdopterin-guanine dinucleotide biosynthesis protein A